jgi:hypothetical protein
MHSPLIHAVVVAITFQKRHPANPVYGPSTQKEKLT